MLTYFVSSSNNYTIRTSPTASGEFTMSLQDMTRLTNTTASLSGITYDGYESILEFTASIGNAVIGEEYRVTLLNSGSSTPIWHGTINVFAQQEFVKDEYTNQIPLSGSISYESTNEYIILD